jgi:hypothetical protein
MFMAVLGAAAGLWLTAYALTAAFASLPAAGRWIARQRHAWGRGRRSEWYRLETARLENWAVTLHALNASLRDSWRSAADRDCPDDDRPEHGAHRSGAQHLKASSIRFRVEYSAEHGGYRPVAVVAS